MIRRVLEAITEADDNGFEVIEQWLTKRGWVRSDSYVANPESVYLGNPAVTSSTWSGPYPGLKIIVHDHQLYWEGQPSYKELLALYIRYAPETDDTLHEPDGLYDPTKGHVEVSVWPMTPVGLQKAIRRYKRMFDIKYRRPS